jgi:tetratricopeptide (TPR) repeat protein
MRLFLFTIVFLIGNNSISQNTALDYYNSGTSKGLTEDYIAAINYFNKALELEPKYEDALYSRGICQLRKKNYKSN